MSWVQGRCTNEHERFNPAAHGDQEASVCSEEWEGESNCTTWQKSDPSHDIKEQQECTQKEYELLLCIDRRETMH